MGVTFVLGTRPEVIKLAPVIREVKKRGLKATVVHTGQHTTLAEDLYRFFEIKVDLDLQVMLEKPNLSHLSARIISRLEDAGLASDSDWVVVQGDTTTAFAGAYWGFCNRVPVAHVEAGLRTFDLASPFPEEGNRQLVSKITNLHFAPTSQSAANLRSEGVRGSDIHTVGNTSIDALTYALGKIERGDVSPIDRLNPSIESFLQGSRVALVTAHRRENVGEPLLRICRAVKELVARHPDLKVVLPVHPNPNIKATILSELDGHKQILCCPAQGYIAFAQLMAKADIILTDSGGVQEEAPTLRKPILVLRESTERPEGVEAGFAQLLGSDVDAILAAADKALADGCTASGLNPYGDGRSSEKIVDALLAGKPIQPSVPIATTGATLAATSRPQVHHR